MLSQYLPKWFASLYNGTLLGAMPHHQLGETRAMLQESGLEPNTLDS